MSLKEEPSGNPSPRARIGMRKGPELSAAPSIISSARREPSGAQPTVSWSCVSGTVTTEGMARWRDDARCVHSGHCRSLKAIQGEVPALALKTNLALRRMSSLPSFLAKASRTAANVQLVQMVSPISGPASTACLILISYSCGGGGGGLGFGGGATFLGAGFGSGGLGGAGEGSELGCTDSFTRGGGSSVSWRRVTE